MKRPIKPEKTLELLTVGGGCFWCIEAIFNEVKGVESTVSGYMGGTVPGSPTYREVCSGLTGHVEVVQVSFDPSVIAYGDLLTIFMTCHDPTTPNGQLKDFGSQYRSVVFFHNGDQKKRAEKIIEAMAPHYDKPIMTELIPVKVFHKAEEAHQNYYANHPTAAYCTAMITPKLATLRKLHANKLITNQADKVY